MKFAVVSSSSFVPTKICLNSFIPRVGDCYGTDMDKVEQVITYPSQYELDKRDLPLDCMAIVFIG